MSDISLFLDNKTEIKKGLFKVLETLFCAYLTV